MAGFGRTIRELRLKKNHTVQDIATYLNITSALVRDIEEGYAHATKNQVFTLASYFGLDAKDLLIIYQTERVLSEERMENNAPRSCLVKNQGVALKRYANMKHELDQLRCGKFAIRVHRPHDPLDRYIESMTFYNGHDFGSAAETVMPDGTVQLFISLDGDERQLKTGTRPRVTVKDTWVTGIQKQHMTYHLKRSQKALSIRFHPGGFYALTHIPQTHLENAVIPADLLMGRSVAELKAAILCETDAEEIFRKAEGYFKKKMKQEDVAQAVVAYMCRHSLAPVSFLVRKTGYSQKHLIHLFKKHIGVTPKYFQRISRFNSVLNDIQAMKKPVDWTGIAFNNHYFDQAHFIRDFVHFAGLSPQTYMESGSTCARFIYSK